MLAHPNLNHTALKTTIIGLLLIPGILELATIVVFGVWLAWLISLVLDGMAYFVQDMEQGSADPGHDALSLTPSTTPAAPDAPPKSPDVFPEFQPFQGRCTWHGHSS